MQRKAIVIVPSEEDFKARTEAQEKAECKDVPDNAVMEMKGIKTSEKKNSRKYLGLQTSGSGKNTIKNKHKIIYHRQIFLDLA